MIFLHSVWYRNRTRDSSSIKMASFQPVQIYWNKRCQTWTSIFLGEVSYAFFVFLAIFSMC
uniref:Uncharacterized protein n=1 Tax=Rhizophora mucronata TaxID=61149 RepID=A0A2P2KXW1_RHIMU